MGLSVWRETFKKLTVYRVCYTPIETLFTDPHRTESKQNALTRTTECVIRYQSPGTSIWSIWATLAAKKTFFVCFHQISFANS